MSDLTFIMQAITLMVIWFAFLYTMTTKTPGGVMKKESTIPSSAKQEPTIVPQYKPDPQQPMRVIPMTPKRLPMKTCYNHMEKLKKGQLALIEPINCTFCFPNGIDIRK